MDFLSKWIQKLSDLNFIVPPFPQCKVCLLYADDTLLLLRPTTSQLDKIKLIFLIFGQISGLKINLAKSELALTSSPPSLTQSLASVIQCKPGNFPIKYLGLPLSDKPLSRAHYNSLIDKTQSLLPKWKAPLLSIGGRMILVNAVMTALLQFFMSTFLLPKWVLLKIDKVRRNFLWHGHKEQTIQLKRLYMVNWTLVTRPRESGGLGVRNISVVNQTLLMKWLWLWHHDDQAWWKSATQMRSQSDRPWDDLNATTFWKKMKPLLPAFNSSIRFEVRNGRKTQFWHDQWLGAPLKTIFPNLYNLVNTKHASVEQCFYNNGWDIQHAPLTTLAQIQKTELILHLQNAHISQFDDKVKWLRATDYFSVSSAYNFLTDTPSPSSEIKNIWLIRAPLRVQIFAWLLLNDRLTTTDNLVKRGWQLPNMCIMCKQQEKNVPHLFRNCLLIREIRNYILTAFGSRFPFPPHFNITTLPQRLLDTKEDMAIRRWEITICFVIWRERCRRLFSDRQLQPIPLEREIATEYKSWFQREH